MMLRRFFFVTTVLMLPLVGAPSKAQDYDRPPGTIGEDRGYGSDAPEARVDSPDPAGLAVRIGRLETRVREMTGQIEELQNSNRKLVEQIQKMQADADSRITAPRVKHSDAGETPSVGAGANVEATKSAPRKSRDDTFDPDASPSAPGTPKPLGSTASARSDDAPMDLAGGKLRRSDVAPEAPLAPTLRPSAPPRVASTTGADVPEATPETPRAAYDSALGLYRDKQYEAAEKGFSAFIQKNPKNRLVADATYFLGESYAQRGRSREAAEQYLKISTDYATSTRAPDAMLHLGMSLKALGAKEQACATFSEVSRKYPNAPAYVRSGAEREAKKSQC